MKKNISTTLIALVALLSVSRLAAEDGTPQPFATIDLTTEAVTYPYAIGADLSAEIFAKENISILIDVTMPASISGRKALVCACDPTAASVTSAIGTSASPYVAFGMNGSYLSYLTSSCGTDRYSSKTTTLSASTNYKIVYTLDKTNKAVKFYINGASEYSNTTIGTSFQDFAHLATNDDTKENAQIYIGGGMVNTTTGWDVFAGQIHSVQFFDTALSAEEIADLNYAQAYPFTVEVDGLDANNPNTHLGTIAYSYSSSSKSIKLTANDETTKYLKTDGESDVTLSLSRKYRGFEFTGFYLGEESLGTAPTLTIDKLNSIINDGTSLVAKFTTTNDVTLFYDDDPKSYRIPAIGTTSSGRLIAVSDYRHSLDDIGRDKHGTGSKRIDLVIRTSDNNGSTWSDIKTIAQGSDVDGQDDCAYGDAAIAVSGEKILVMAAGGYIMYPSTTADAHNRAVRIMSEDNGENWELEDITETLWGYDGSLFPDGYGAFFGSGKLAVDTDFNGTGTTRIYGALLLRNSTSSYNNFVIYSDDWGINWSILGGSDEPVAGGDEPKVEILPNGQICLSVRRSGGRTFNIFTYGESDDEKSSGSGEWSGTSNGCGNGGSNSTNGEILCIDAKNGDGEAVKLLLQSQPKGGSGLYDRRNVTIWYKEISADETYTSQQIAGDWIEGVQVSDTLSAYSTMSVQDDGKIAFFFEEAPCYDDNYEKGYSMVYVPLTTELITNGTYFSTTTDPTATTTVNVTLTDAQGNTYCETLEDCALNSVESTLTGKYTYITLGSDGGFIPSSDGLSWNYTNSVTLPFEVSSDDTEIWYNIYFPSYGSSARPIYLASGSESDTYVTKVVDTNAAYGYSTTYNTQNYADKISWAVYNVNNSFSFIFKNKLTEKYMQATSVSSSNSNNVVYVDKAEATAFTLIPDAASYNGDYSLSSVIEDVTGYLCSTSASYDYPTNFERNNHQGGWMKFAEAPDFDTLIADVNAGLAYIGEGLGEYSVSDSYEELLAEAKTAMSDAGSVTYYKLINYQTMLDGATLNLPASGGFYRIAYDYGTAGIKYMQGVAGTKGVAYTDDKEAA